MARQFSPTPNTISVPLLFRALTLQPAFRRLFQARSGTATWFHLEGDDFGIPFGPYEQVTGGDDLPNSTQWKSKYPPAGRTVMVN